MRIRMTRLGVVLAVLGVTRADAQRLDERVLPREVVSEVLAIWNASTTQRVNGPYVVARDSTVAGALVVVGGGVEISGRVGGEVVMIEGDVRLMPGARIDGGILVVGGEVTGSEGATIAAGIRTYRVRAAGDEVEEGRDPTPWWRRRERWQARSWGDLRLVSARTYNRVEGLPIHIGPSFGRDFGTGRVAVDALGILRSADRFEWKPENVGHLVKTEVQLGHERGVRLGGRLFDVVQGVEPWHLSDEEVGLASFVLHRDFRDYYNRHGGSVYASLFRGRAFDLTVTYADERWATRATRDPWTLFRNSQAWRINPAMDEGNFHLVQGTLRYDTRNDPGAPWSGWFITAEYEYGTGDVSRYAVTSPWVRDESPNGATTYDRALLDVRRYNRITPDLQLDFRVVAGGWLSGDDLPVQRRFSVGGPGSLPGYDFRRTVGTPDVWQCASSVGGVVSAAPGTPAQCERFILGQIELRGDMLLDPFGVLDEERDFRRSGWGRGTDWVLFADVGRGWLVGDGEPGLFYGKGQIPRLSSFRADVGIGLVFDDVGVYVARGVTSGRTPVNVFVRLRPRF